MSLTSGFSGYALLYLDTLRIVRFQSKDELRDAIKDCLGFGKTFEAFSYSESAGVWAQLDVAHWSSKKWL